MITYVPSFAPNGDGAGKEKSTSGGLTVEVVPVSIGQVKHKGINK